jgi:hypothetical protein
MANNINLKKIISDAEKIGIANPTKVRNIEIRREFREMRDNFVKYDDALYKLAQKYFLSISSIQQIISGYKNNEY